MLLYVIIAYYSINIASMCPYFSMLLLYFPTFSHWTWRFPGALLDGRNRGDSPRMVRQRWTGRRQGRNYGSATTEMPIINGYGSIPINTIFRGMNIHLPAILMFKRGTRFWRTAIYWDWSGALVSILFLWWWYLFFPSTSSLCGYFGLSLFLTAPFASVCSWSAVLHSMIWPLRLARSIPVCSPQLKAPIGFDI